MGAGEWGSTLGGAALLDPGEIVEQPQLCFPGAVGNPGNGVEIPGSPAPTCNRSAAGTKFSCTLGQCDLGLQ